MRTPVMPDTQRDRQTAWGTGILAVILVVAAVLVMIHSAHKHHVEVLGSVGIMIVVLIILAILVLWIIDRVRTDDNAPMTQLSLDNTAHDRQLVAGKEQVHSSDEATLPAEKDALPATLIVAEDSTSLITPPLVDDTDEANLPTEHQEAAAERLFEQLRDWAVQQPALRAAAVIDAWAEQPQAEAPIRLVFLADDPEQFETGDAWAQELGASRITHEGHHDDEVVRHFQLPDGLEVSVEIFPVSEAAHARGDEAARYQVIYDPDQLWPELPMTEPDDSSRAVINADTDAATDPNN